MSQTHFHTSECVVWIHDSPEVVDLVLHHFGRVGETFETFKLLHLFLRLNVAALAQQDVVFWDLSGSAGQVVFEGRNYAFALEGGEDEGDWSMRFLIWCAVNHEKTLKLLNVNLWHRLWAKFLQDCSGKLLFCRTSSWVRAQFPQVEWKSVQRREPMRSEPTAFLSCSKNKGISNKITVKITALRT